MILKIPMTLAIVAAFAAAFIIFAGFIVHKIWLWFVIPAFPAAPHIGLWTASGLCLMVRAAIFHTRKENKDDISFDEFLTKRVLPNAVGYSAILLIAYVIYILVR